MDLDKDEDEEMGDADVELDEELSRPIHGRS